MTSGEGGVVSLVIEGIDDETGTIEVGSPAGETVRVPIGRGQSSIELRDYRVGSNTASPITVTPYSRFDLPPGLGGSPSGAAATVWGNGIGAPTGLALTLELGIQRRRDIDRDRSRQRDVGRRRVGAALRDRPRGRVLRCHPRRRDRILRRARRRGRVLVHAVRRVLVRRRLLRALHDDRKRPRTAERPRTGRLHVRRRRRSERVQLPRGVGRPRTAHVLRAGPEPELRRVRRHPELDLRPRPGNPGAVRPRAMGDRDPVGDGNPGGRKRAVPGAGSVECAVLRRRVGPRRRGRFVGGYRRRQGDDHLRQRRAALLRRRRRAAAPHPDTWAVPVGAERRRGHHGVGRAGARPGVSRPRARRSRHPATRTIRVRPVPDHLPPTRSTDRGTGT